MKINSPKVKNAIDKKYDEITDSYNESIFYGNPDNKICLEDVMLDTVIFNKTDFSCKFTKNFSK